MSAPHRPVRTVILGNSFAARVQVPGLRWSGGADILGIAGHDAAKARATALELKIPMGTGRWEELIALEPELVLVSTPVDLHRSMVLAALEAGAAVLCEKPFAMNVFEAEGMTRAVGNKPAWIDHELRWSPYLRELRRRVQSGCVGAAWVGSFELFIPPAQGRAKPWCWWFDAERGGGVLGALGSHMIDTMVWIMGEVTHVRASLRSLTGERADKDGQFHAVTADELALVELKHASGATSELRTSTVLHQDRFFRLQVEGANGCLLLTGEDQLSASDSTGSLEEIKLAVEYPTCSEMGLPEYGPFGRCFPLFARDLLRTIAAGEAQLNEAATFGDGLVVQRVLDAARRSSASHGGWEPCQ